ncbi:MAG: hypothetical protein EAX95_06260 [Candidatus Thorarchaeota archaeon]|nr:hypothetical protein [Candidatus Thorarchaeota archaeon]
MRNIIGGVIAALLGALCLGGILAGADILRQTYPLVFDASYALPLLLTWMLLGVISGAFSNSPWNSVRTAVWIGTFLSILSVANILSNNPEFWTSPDRNFALLIIFIGTLMTSLLTVPSAVVVISVKTHFLREKERPPPTKIESVCSVCGAVFKSVPLMCSECGAAMTESETSGV